MNSQFGEEYLNRAVQQGLSGLHESLRKEINFTEAVLANAGALVLALDCEGRIRRFNRACEALTQYSFAEVEGRQVWDLFLLPTESRDVYENAFLKLIDNPQMARGRHTNHWMARDGSIYLIDWFNSLLFDERGEVEYLVTVGIDVTAKRATEDALRRSEETYAKAETIAHIGSWNWDIETGGLSWTDEVFRIFGFFPQSFASTYEAFLAAIHPEDRLVVIDAVHASLADASVPYSIEHRVVRPDGEIRYVHEHGKVYRNDQGAPVRMIGTVHDITERRQASLEYRTILQTTSDGFWMVSPTDGHLIDVNQAACEMIGYSREEMLAMTIADFEASESPEEVRRHMEAIMQGQKRRFETRHRHKDGRLIEVDISVQYSEIRGGVFVSFLRDITERKRNETELSRYRLRLEEEVEARTRALQQAQAELLKREKLATLGQLTATVSHELRNPLGAMRPSLLLLKRHLAQDDDKGHQALERIERNIVRCDNIIDELLDFTRIRDLRPLPVALDPWLKEVLAEQKSVKGLQIILEMGLERIPLAMDSDRMRRAVINVFDNACHAMEERREKEGAGFKPCLKVSTRRGESGRCEIEFADNGVGMNEATMSRIFEPLFSTKGFGVGLGMPAVQLIMQQHGGGIEVTSQPGQGTQMLLWLPASQGGREE